MMHDFLIGRKIRTVVKGKYTTWTEVNSAFPQGSVFARITILIYIDDIEDNIGIESYIWMFADDAKLQRKINNKTHAFNYKMI